MVGGCLFVFGAIMKLEDVSNSVVYALLAFALLFSAFEVFFTDFIPVKAYLLVIVSTLIVLHGETRKIANLKAAITVLDQKFASTRVSVFEKPADFYKSLQAYVKHTKKELLLTHVRHHPPESFQSGKPYFDWVNDWAEREEDVVVKRIGGLFQGSTEKWCKEQISQALEKENYQFRYLVDSISLVNFAIIDKKAVFLSIPGESKGETTGYFIEDEKLALNYKAYFDFLWQNAQVE